MSNLESRIDKHFRIVKRAQSMGIAIGEQVTQLMDIEFADRYFNLRLDEFLNADDFNFAHDFIGIQRNINRVTKQFENCFVPRFAGHCDYSDGTHTEGGDNT